MAHGAAVWLPFVQPFGTVFLGIGAFSIAYRQWLTASEKLKLDLYDKKYALLTKILDEYMIVFREGVQAQSALREMYAHFIMFDTLFREEASLISAKVRPVLWRLIGLRKDKYDAESAQADYQKLVDSMLKLQTAALAEMRVGVSRTTWLPKIRKGS